MKAFGYFTAALLGLFAGALLIAWLAGWDAAADWGDTRAPSAIWLATISALAASGILGAARQNVSQTVFSLLAWAGAFLVLILAYSYRAEVTEFWGRIRGEVLTGEAVVTAEGAVEIRRNRDTHFYVDASLNGAPVTFMIDTGASGVALSWADAEAAGLDPARLSFDLRVETASGPALVARAQIGRLAIGPIERRNLAVIVLPEGVTMSLLGQSFLNTLASFEVSGDRMTLRD